MDQPSADQPGNAANALPRHGHLDSIGRDHIEGWAFDPNHPGGPARLRLVVNDITLAVIEADRLRPDLAKRGFRGGLCAFDWTIPGGLAPHVQHIVQVQWAADGQDIAGSPGTIEPDPHADTPTPGGMAQPGMRGAMPGHLDQVGRDRVAGWAHDPATPGEPVALQILDNGVLLARALANHYRRDLADAGIGRGQHGFEWWIPGGFSPTIRHVIQVRRESDGADLKGSPAVIEAATSFDPALQQAITASVDALDTPESRTEALHFLMAQADRVLEHQAAADGQRSQRVAYEQFRRRWGPARQAIAALIDPGKRALVIDETVPIADQDAGSQALLSHIQALQRLGYAVTFAASEQLREPAPGLAALGVTVCSAPFYTAIEDVLRRQRDCFDVIYMHRMETAARYLSLARRCNRRARLLYSVADLHHVRLNRQARIEGRPDMMPASNRARLLESTAAWLADTVITHSSTELEMLNKAVPTAAAYRVPWHIPVRPTATAWEARRGIAFIGGYGHAPNVDAAIVLVEAVMPLVWQIDPTIECVLVGGGMPDGVKRLQRPGVLALGHIPDLAAGVFDRVRLTVAPLRFGAGVKGKVLQSFAAGVPCVMTPVAAEGIALPPVLQDLVGQDAALIAALIVKLHNDHPANAAAAAAGLAMMQQDFSEDAVATALEKAIAGTAADA